MNYKGILDLLDYFVLAYRNRPNTGFFHHHGNYGKVLAQDFQQAWQAEKSNLLAENYDSDLSFIKATRRCLQNLMSSFDLPGNCYQHSLKNYLLAYYDALALINNGKINLEASNTDIFSIAFVSRWEKAEPIKIETAYNKIEQAQGEPQRYRASHSF